MKKQIYPNEKVDCRNPLTHGAEYGHIQSFGENNAAVVSAPNELIHKVLIIGKVF